MHAMLEHHYLHKAAAGTLHDLIHDSLAVGNKFLESNELPTEQAVWIKKTYEQYARYYWPTETWKTLFVEKSFFQTLYEDDNLKITYHGKIDLVVQSPEGIYLVDHKTTSRKLHAYSLSNQFLGYSWSTGVSYFYLNEIGLQQSASYTPERKFKRHILSYNKPLLNEWARNAVFAVKQFLAYQITGFFPRNFSSCKSMYGPCIFTSICESPNDEEFIASTDFRVEKWDPTERLEEKA